MAYKFNKEFYHVIDIAARKYGGIWKYIIPNKNLCGASVDCPTCGSRQIAEQVVDEEFSEYPEIFIFKCSKCKRTGVWWA